MAIPRDRAELLRAITEEYAKLARDLARVPESRSREASLPGHRAGTTMSPADLVAYLVGWNELVLSWHEQRERGVDPAMPAEGYGWNQLGELAERFARDRAAVSWPELLARLERAKSAIVALVERLDDGTLYGAPWYRGYTAGRMIQLNTSSPYANARRRLRAWLREQGIPG